MQVEVSEICKLLDKYADSIIVQKLNSTKVEVRNAFIDVACEAHYSGKTTLRSEKIFNLGSKLNGFVQIETKYKVKKSPTVAKKSKLQNPLNLYQKYEVVEEGSPLYIYYSSLYEENPRSKLALKWLVEHGMLNDSISLNKFKNSV